MKLNLNVQIPQRQSPSTSSVTSTHTAPPAGSSSSFPNSTSCLRAFGTKHNNKNNVVGGKFESNLLHATLANKVSNISKPGLLRRTNSTNSMSISMSSGSICNPNTDSLLNAISYKIHACLTNQARSYFVPLLQVQALNGNCSLSMDKSKFYHSSSCSPNVACFTNYCVQQQFDGVFNSLDTGYHEWSEDEKLKGLLQVSTAKAIRSFMKRIFKKSQLVEECAVLSLLYFVRFLNAKVENKAGVVILHRYNWKGIVLACMLLASKVWDDMSMRNIDFSLITPQFSLQQINKMEVALLKTIKFDVRVSGVDYAKYFFHLRDLSKEVESNGGLDLARFDNKHELVVFSDNEISPMSNHAFDYLERLQSFEKGTEVEANEEKFPDFISPESELKKRNVRIISRRKTLFGGASPEWLQKVHEKGYCFTAIRSGYLASFEDIMLVRQQQVF